ncbi:hypothetical protein pb186bvf_018554 [Paramecium bursaria]
MIQQIDSLLSGQTIKLQHTQVNEVLFSNGELLSTGTKSIMLGCSKDYLNDNTKFTIHLAYVEFGNLDNHPIYFGDLVYIKHQDKIIQINIDHKSQSTQQCEACLIPFAEVTARNIFVILPENDGISKSIANFQFEIRQAQIINLVNIESYHSLHSHKNTYKQKEFVEFKEVTGFHKRDDNDGWFITIEQNILEVPKPRFKKHVHHLDKCIIRNFQLGMSLHSHSVNLKSGSKNQEVTINGRLPRDRNDLWELIIYKIDLKARSSQIISHLAYKSYFSLLHIETNSMLTNYKGQKNSDGTHEACCKEGQMNFDEWQVIPLRDNQKDLVTCNQPFGIRHTPTGLYLCGSKDPSNPTKAQMRVFLTQKMMLQLNMMIEKILSFFFILLFYANFQKIQNKNIYKIRKKLFFYHQIHKKMSFPSALLALPLLVLTKSVRHILKKLKKPQIIKKKIKLLPVNSKCTEYTKEILIKKKIKKIIPKQSHLSFDLDKLASGQMKSYLMKEIKHPKEYKKSQEKLKDYLEDNVLSTGTE